MDAPTKSATMMATSASTIFKMKVPMTGKEPGSYVVKLLAQLSPARLPSHASGMIMVNAIRDGNEGPRPKVRRREHESEPSAKFGHFAKEARLLRRVSAAMLARLRSAVLRTLARAATRDDKP